VPGTCFRDGNCFGRCVCGQPGCPNDGDFWALLEKNVSGSLALQPAATRARFQANVKQVRPESIAQHIRRLEQFFSDRSKH
jgi:hypothetical protein